MLIKRGYEIDPLQCPKCAGKMKEIAFIKPPQGAVIERILRHCGLWQPSTPRAPPDDWGLSPSTTWSTADFSFADGSPESFDDGEALADWYVDADPSEATFVTVRRNTSAKAGAVLVVGYTGGQGIN